MRILLIHQNFLEKRDSGGSRLNEMSRFWAGQGHQITVLAGMVHYATGKKHKRYKGKVAFMDKGFYKDVDVVRCHVSESYNKNFLGRLWAYFSFVLSSSYAGAFKVRGKYDAILVTSPPLFVAITGYVLSLTKRIPFIFEVRDLWPESAIDTGVLKSIPIIKFAYWFERFIYRKAILINVLTPAFREKLIKEKDVPEEKVIFIPNAADFAISEKIQKDFDAVEFKKNLGLSDKFVITYVGAHGVANHLIQLIDTAEKLKDTNVVFQLIGDGMQKAMLQEKVLKRALSDMVIFRNPVPKEEVFKYILSSDMGASVLKRVDTFKTIYSNKTFDYMSCKRPILLAIEGVSKDLIDEANCGLCVIPEDIDDISSRIRAYKDKKKLQQEQGENGYHYAKKYFDRTYLADKYLKHIERAI